MFFVSLHLIFLFLLFSPQNILFFGVKDAIPPVFSPGSKDKEGNALAPIDHLRFNLQWSVVIFSMYLYPAVISDRLPVHVRSRKGQQTKGWPRWLRRLSKNNDAVRALGVINCIMGVTTIVSYIYQTYQHEKSLDWFGSEDVKQNTNLILCIIDTGVDAVALAFVCGAMIYIPLAHQRLSYLTNSDTMFLILGASSNLVYCLQIFYAYFMEPTAIPDPHTLTFFRIFPIVSFINWIAPRYLANSQEEWDLYEIGLRLLATCIMVAGIMVTTERLGSPSDWDPSLDDAQGWTFFKSLWFTVVTTSTVG